MMTSTALLGMDMSSRVFMSFTIEHANVVEVSIGLFWICCHHEKQNQRDPNNQIGVAA
jgi:hypothetical protein